ncbi:hypothetical protein C8Q77DRAFT_1067174 [Trametes polyzona]|nr:hypothetical protein C8Q77DRAFT_1067174 [Trametes polyzona]
MTASSRPRLPTELVHIICSLTRKSDLPAVALASKLFNEMCTPLLYRTIDLYAYANAQKCAITLASAPSKLAFGRDLGPLVHSLVIHGSCFEFTGVPLGFDPRVDALWALTIRRMPNLRTFRCLVPTRPRGIYLLTMLLANPPPSLRVLDLVLSYAVDFPQFPVPVERVFQRLLITPPVIPQLSEFSLFLPTGSLTANVDHVLHTLLASSANTLRTLRITSSTHRDAFQAISPPLSLLPAIQTLSLHTSSLIKPGMGHMSMLRALRVYNTFYMHYRDAVLSPAAWPALEDLTCDPDTLHMFLNPDLEPDQRRPISTLRLSHVVYEHNGGDDGNVDIVPRWRDVLEALELVEFSATPLKHLAFSVTKLKIHRFELLLPIIGGLESMVVSFSVSPNMDDVFALGAAIIARLPRLHTFLLSDANFKASGQNRAFRFARDLALQRSWLAEFSRHSSVLRHVAFTTEFEWEKGADGAWFPTELPKDGPVVWLEAEEDDGDSEDEDEMDYGEFDEDEGDEEEEDD